MSAPELKPCPFCGGSAEFSLGKTGDGGDWHYVECADCEALGPHVRYADHNIAVQSALTGAWNTRTDTIPSDPRVKALVEALEGVCQHLSDAMVIHGAPDDSGSGDAISAAKSALARMKEAGE